MRGLLAQFGARVAELHPVTWWLAWKAIHHMTFLLPHDKSYNALRHFIAARPQGLFLDIGANDGISALSFRRFDRAYKIVSLEPNSLLEAPLKRISRTDQNFEFRMIGAASKRERIKFFVPVYRGIVLHTFASANRDHILDAIAESFGNAVRARIRTLTIESDVIPVDDLDLAPSIIKIDAEGFNLDVLLGAQQTLQGARPFVIVELEQSEWDDLNKLFAGIDYRLLGYRIDRDQFVKIENPGKSRVSGERNIFAVPREMLPQMPLAS